MSQAIQALRTARLRIDPLTLADTEGLLSVYGDEVVMTYLPVTPLRDLESARDLLATYVDRIATGAQFRWALRTHESDAMIGALKLAEPCDAGRSSEVGYVLAQSAWGKGFATEAMQALMEYAFLVLDRHRLEALIYADNQASRKLVTRLGFRLEGYFKEHEWKQGRYWDDTIYAILRQEWDAARHASSPTA